MYYSLKVVINYKFFRYSDRLTDITADANVFSTSARFDRIISVEMFEHMKNYEQLFERVASWLKPDG